LTIAHSLRKNEPRLQRISSGVAALQRAATWNRSENHFGRVFCFSSLDNKPGRPRGCYGVFTPSERRQKAEGGIKKWDAEGAMGIAGPSLALLDTANRQAKTARTNRYQNQFFLNVAALLAAALLARRSIRTCGWTICWSPPAGRLPKITELGAASQSKSFYRVKLSSSNAFSTCPGRARTVTLSVRFTQRMVPIESIRNSAGRAMSVPPGPAPLCRRS